MRENCTSGSVAGAPGNRSPYAGGDSFSSLPPGQGIQGETVVFLLFPPYSRPLYRSSDLIFRRG